MTRLGAGCSLLGLAVAAAGFAVHWAQAAVLGSGLVVLALGSLAYVLYRPRLELERVVEPRRVEKGLPAIALIHVENASRRSLPPLDMEQRLGDDVIRSTLPRLRHAERSVRTYRLPTTRRGIFEIGPVELPRADPFGLCRTVQRLGEPQQIEVHPRQLALRPLPTGLSKNLEGPSSDAAPQGTITFHRIREYAVGDDLRLVHWASTAHTGKLMVRHNVDTAQPYTVVLLDLDPDVYSADSFEEAVDVASSVVTSMGSGRAPVQLRTTSGARIGGPAQRDPTPLIDYLTRVAPATSSSLHAQLVLLRRDRGGTALVVVTGRLRADSLPMVAALRRRFDRVVAVSLTQERAPAPVHPGLTVVSAETAEELARVWNSRIAR
ncbi:MAG TPA: DUF58 domain-containing protein [Acidimicrobiales bacterium]|nr:DUF58 domain-containing protein [Acidimicrobiales bacterium]